MTDPIIRVEHLKKSFGDHEVLCDVNFEAQKGDVVCIIGASGSGKSTLLRCINLLEKPTSGLIAYHGRDIRDGSVGLAEYHAKVGMVFQSFNLFHNMTALENCVIGQVKALKRSRQQAEENAMRYLNKVGMAPFIHAKPRQLSGGQKQRVAIARALAMQPKVLLCDEATSALDPMTTRAILDLLRDINERLGITIVVITHEMEVIRQICRKVSIIDGGRIVESGAVSELFSRPQSEAGRRMFRGSVRRFSELPTGRLVRVIFDGEAVYEPLIANLVIEHGAPVSIISAQMDTVAGETRGQLVLQLPADKAMSDRMIQSLRKHNLGVAFAERPFFCKQSILEVYGYQQRSDD